MKNAFRWLVPTLVALAVLTIGTRASALANSSDAERAIAYAKLSPVADRYVLNGDALPVFEFAQPEVAHGILGKYELKGVVYDPEYRPVTTASKPGRYGAVVEIIPEEGSKLPSSRRFISLYRLPDEASFEQQAPALVTRLKGQRWNFKDVPGANTAENARELAALHEVPRDASPDGFYQQPVEKERQWWIGLKRRLYGFDKDPRFSIPFRAPLPAVGNPAPVIREGTAAEAGMKEDAARAIDEVLQRWAADSEEGFDVCIVRHGVVVLRKSCLFSVPARFF